MIKLRPHHLLCTQGYSGKGYDNDFVIHMNEVVDVLRNEKGTKVELVCNTDTLCSCCPNKLGENLCDTQEKVARFDSKTLECFGFKEAEYVYEEAVEKIRDQVTPEKLEYICEGCSWYPVSACREKILQKYYKSNN